MLYGPILNLSFQHGKRGVGGKRHHLKISYHVRTFLAIQAMASLCLLLGLGEMVWGQQVYEQGPRLQSSKPTLLDGFGFAVASDGIQVLVGAPHTAGMRGQTGKAFLFQRESGDLQREFIVPSPIGDDLFGLSLGLTAQHVIVGAPRGQGGGRRSVGSVSVFDRDTGKIQRVVNSPNPTVAAFGHALATQGPFLAIGDPGASTSANFDVGEAYLVDLSDGNILQTFASPQAKQSKPDGFGHSLMFLGKTLAIGAPLSGTHPLDHGQVFLFDHTNGELKATLQSPDPQTDEYFGWALAGDKELLVVGALGRGAMYPEAGAVYLFTSAGQFVKTLKAPDPQRGDHFGEAVALLDEYIVVAAPGDDSAGVDAGSVFVFDRITKNLHMKISNPSAMTGIADLFGLSLSGTGDSVMVGSPYGDLPNMPDAGLVHQFKISIVEKPKAQEPVADRQR